MKWFFSTFVVLLFVSPAASEPPQLRQAPDLAVPIQILAGTKPLDVEREGHSAPEAGDFNSDGVRDLLVGQYDEGRLRIYLNSGTNRSPRFDEFTWFIAGDQPGRVQEGCCIGFCPQLVDLDRDGLTDIISGSFPGEVSFFRRQADGNFASARTLRGQDGKPLNIGSRASAFAVDWDGNGTLDLIIGTIVGEVYFLPGDRIAGEPRFGDARKIEAAGEPILIQHGEASPVAADWDGDGKLDLVIGAGHGSVLWYRNMGSRQAPELQAAQMLVGESPVGWGSDQQRAAHDWGVRVKPCVVDWDGDGRMDLLLGDRCGSFLAKPKQTTAEKEEERQVYDRLPQLRKSWSSAFAEYREMQGKASAEADLLAARSKLGRLKDEISRLQEIQQHYQPGHQAHGFVWLFLRTEGRIGNNELATGGP